MQTSRVVTGTGGSEQRKDTSDISQFDKLEITYYVSPPDKHFLVLKMVISSDLSDLTIGSESCTYIAVGLFEQFGERS